MVMGYAGVIVLAWFFLDILGIGMTVWLLRRVWRREKTGLKTKVVASLLAAPVLYGALQTLLGLLKVFTVVGRRSVDPAQAAAQLAEGISKAMNCTVFALAIGIPSAIAASLITRPSKARSS